MLWTALLPSAPNQLTGLTLWCLQFTPRVALAEPASTRAAVVFEVEGSARLFGGKRQLVRRLRDEARTLGVDAVAWAPTSLGALALARAGLRNGFGRPLPEILDPLRLDTLAAALPHVATLDSMGCRTLGALRALPRGGVARRFGATVLDALDVAYGLRPAAHTWVTIPERFDARLELPQRVEQAPAMLFGARRLMLQLSGWLSARQCGITVITLSWSHDAMRSKDAGAGGALTVRTAQATRAVEHLMRLLGEHLARVTLAAPVGDLQLSVDEADIVPLPVDSLDLLPDTRASAQSLNLALERIAARLGPERVLRPRLVEDHRPERMATWHPASEKRPRAKPRCPTLPQPTLLLPEPMRLAMRGGQPLYQGPLLLLVGPHRVEGGWWASGQSGGTGVPQSHPQVATRDYWIALTERGAALWIFQTRLAAEAGHWFLHGHFA
ncbi:Y-family DNA polymerase [Paracidovorax citrulli]|uniref:Y-family DNA polymerase n=1 Tax=Paracidovorax citrulli TaxID=80869 RepID=UPI003FA7CA30